MEMQTPHINLYDMGPVGLNAPGKPVDIKPTDCVRFDDNQYFCGKCAAKVDATPTFVLTDREWAEQFDSEAKCRACNVRLINTEAYIGHREVRKAYLTKIVAWNIEGDKVCDLDFTAYYSPEVEHGVGLTQFDLDNQADEYGTRCLICEKALVN
jgi:DNA-directed RNA polymerase subunit RPC12/RpoP